MWNCNSTSYVKFYSWQIERVSLRFWHPFFCFLFLPREKIGLLGLMKFVLAIYCLLTFLTFPIFSTSPVWLTDFFVCCTSDKRFANFAKKSVKLSCFFQLRNGVVRVLFCPRLVALFFHIYLFSHGFVVIHRDLNVHKLGWNKYDVVNFC